MGDYKIKFRGKNIWHGKSTSVHGGDIVFVNATGLEMIDGHTYTVSVSAFNKANVGSQEVESNFILDCQPPTSNNDSDIVVEWAIKGQEVEINWQGVFSGSSPLSFEVSGGFYPYGADVIQWYETTLESMIFAVDKNMESKPFYISVRAISSNGLYTTRNWFVRPEGYNFIITRQISRNRW